MPIHDDLSLEAYDYDLPPELIAQRPIEPRDSSRLMVVHRGERRFEHRVFTELLEYLRPGDVMVFNDSRVFPARLYGVRVDTGAKIELLLLRRQSPGVWHTLARPGRRMTPGTTFELRGGTVAIEGEVLEAHDDGSRTVRLSNEGRLDEIGVVPLPPYIQEPLEDPERYQTVYARERGSVAAPTAGLHVTPRLMEKVRQNGVETAFVTLHVGWATFRPVQVEEITDHDMHAEFYSLSEVSAEAINCAKREGRRVIAVGTTTVPIVGVRCLARWWWHGCGPGGFRLGGYLHLSRLYIPGGRRARHELSLAGIDVAHVSERLRRPRTHARGVPGGRGRTVPLLQLWGRDGDHLGGV